MTDRRTTLPIVALFEARYHDRDRRSAEITPMSDGRYAVHCMIWTDHPADRTSTTDYIDNLSDAYAQAAGFLNPELDS